MTFMLNDCFSQLKYRNKHSPDFLVALKTNSFITAVAGKKAA